MSKLSHSTTWAVVWTGYNPSYFGIVPDQYVGNADTVIVSELMLQDATDLSCRLNMELMKSDV